MSEAKSDEIEVTKGNSPTPEATNVPLPSSLQECASNQLTSLIRNDETFNDKVINPFKNDIINYVKDNGINGDAFIKVNRKQFSDNLVVYADDNEKIREAGNKVYDKLTKYEFQVKIYDTIISWNTASTMI